MGWVREGKGGVVSRTRGGEGKKNYNNPALTPSDMDIGHKEVLCLTSNCPHCTKTVKTDLCIMDLPHLKEVVIISLTLEECGYRSNDIKRGGVMNRFLDILIRITFSSMQGYIKQISNKVH